MRLPTFSSKAARIASVSFLAGALLQTSFANTPGPIIRSSYSPSSGLGNAEAPKKVNAATRSEGAKSKSSASAASTSVAPGPVIPNFAIRTGWKRDIVGTVFWVGEQPTENNPTPNCKSSWDTQWMINFGGYDNPDIATRTHGYRPTAFVPRLNPFYVALPFNDVLNHATTKPISYQVIPWFKKTFKRAGKSVCHNRWIAIHHAGRVAYAQWSDCGPFVTDDAAYVFGDAAPTNTSNKGAGIDLSPSVRDYLGFRSGLKCDWRFVEEHEVPDGPWKAYGTNNPFSKSWVKDPEPIFAGAYNSKTTYAAVASGSARKSSSSSKPLRSASGLPGFTLKKAAR